VLGLKTADAIRLRLRLLEIAYTEEALGGELDRYGQRYTIDFEIEQRPAKAP